MANNIGPTRTGIALAALSLVATLVLSGCGDKEEEAGSASSSVTASAAPVGPSISPGVAGITPTPNPDAPGSPTDPVAVAACLPGNWVPHREEFAAMMAGDSTKVVTGIDGNMFLSIQPGGTVNTIYENWTYTFAVGESTVTIVKDGTDQGVYTIADDGSVDITDTSIGSTTNARMTISGTEVVQLVEPQPSVFSLATITCSGDEVTATVASQVAILGREN